MNAETGQAGYWRMEELHITAGTGTIAAAAVKLVSEEDEEVQEAAVGDGPVAAAFRALERATGIELVLKNFELRSVTLGNDAQGEVTVTVEYNGQSFRGQGLSTDIVEAGARAYLEVINRIQRRLRSPAAAPAAAASA